MTPIAILAAGRRVGLRQALLPKGVAFVSSCGIVAAQLALVTFEAPAPPPAPAPPDIIVSLVPVDLARPEPAPRPIVRQVAEPAEKPARTEAVSRAAAKPSPSGTLASAAPVTPAAAPVLGPSPAPTSAAPAPIQTAAVAEPPPRADDALQRYQDLVWRMIMARRPPTAHLRGGAQIAFHLMSNGSPCDIRIARTSGDPMLDRLAIATVQRAGPFPKPPATLRADTEFEIWFQFR
jgi:protein TonB